MIKKVKTNLKFFVLGLFIFTNGLIIFESSLPGHISSQRSNFLTMIASFIINGVTPDRTPDIIDAVDIEVKDHLDQIVSDEDTYQIPLGVTRRFSATVLPLDATDRNYIWTTSNSEVLRVTSGGYLEARMLGENVYVKATSSANSDIAVGFYVDVVEKSAPLDFSVSFDQSDLMVGYSRKLVVELDERAKKEYDPKLLTYHSANSSVATINDFGVINALSVGMTEISISNHSQTYTLNVIENPNEIIYPTSITLDGPLTSYVYGYSSLSYQLDDDVSDKTVTFTSSNEAIATVDEDGIIYGTKVSGEVTIRVYANADFDVYAEHTLNILDVLPTSISLSANNLEVEAGKKTTISATLAHDFDQELPVTNQEVMYTSSNEDIAEVVSRNGQGIVLAKKRGVVTILATSQADPSVKATIDITVKPLEVINEENITTFGAYLRKAVGHFSLFFVNGILGALTFITFLDKKVLITSAISLIPGVFIASLSEFIQYFVEGRGATIFDVLINIFGYLVAVIVVYLLFIIKWKKPEKKAID